MASFFVSMLVISPVKMTEKGSLLKTTSISWNPYPVGCFFRGSTGFWQIKKQVGMQQGGSKNEENIVFQNSRKRRMGKIASHHHRFLHEDSPPSPGILFHAVDHLPSELPREEGKQRKDQRSCWESWARNPSWRAYITCVLSRSKLALFFAMVGINSSTWFRRGVYIH